MAALGAAQKAPLALRVGGNSSDESWWNPARLPRPHRVLYDLGPAWVASLASGQARSAAPVALGLNLALDDPGNALALVRAVRARLKRPGVVSLEIGNEPDLFAVRGPSTWAGSSFTDHGSGSATAPHAT